MADDLAYYYALWRMNELRPEDIPNVSSSRIDVVMYGLTQNFVLE